MQAQHERDVSGQIIVYYNEDSGGKRSFRPEENEVISTKRELSRFLSSKGIFPAKHVDRLIKKRKISLNGEAVSFTQDCPTISYAPKQDTLMIDGRKDYMYIALNKPRGYVTNSPQPDEKQASELIPLELRKSLSSVGRLDKESEGLLFFTNDPTFTHDILNSDYPHTKEYMVWVDPPISDADMQAMSAGEMIVSGSKIKECVVEPVSRHEDGRVWCVRMTLSEGKNRQIRRMVKLVSSEVTRLQRLKIGTVELGALEAGKCRLLTQDEVAAFRHDWVARKDSLRRPEKQARKDTVDEPCACADLQGS